MTLNVIAMSFLRRKGFINNRRRRRRRIDRSSSSSLPLYDGLVVFAFVSYCGSSTKNAGRRHSCSNHVLVARRQHDDRICQLHGCDRCRILYQFKSPLLLLTSACHGVLSSLFCFLRRIMPATCKQNQPYACHLSISHSDCFMLLCIALSETNFLLNTPR